MAEQQLKTEQDIIRRFQELRMKLNNIHGKINELEAELTEHDLVIKTLEPLDKQRKCFRLIGGVLVERTVEEVLPAVQQHRQSLLQVGWASTRAFDSVARLTAGDRVAWQAGRWPTKGAAGVSENVQDPHQG